MTCTVFKLKGANFTLSGLPNITPFVLKSDLKYGYDFRFGVLADYKSGLPLTAYRMNGSKVLDSSVVTTTSDNLFINLEDVGLLVTQFAYKSYAIGTGAFTMLVVGGDGGGTISARSNLLNIGNTGDAASSLPSIEATYTVASGTSRIGVRAKASDLNTGFSDSNTVGKVHFIMVVYDGSNITYYNKTTGTTTTKTLTELGITDMNFGNAGGHNNHMIGKFSPTLNTFKRGCKLGQIGFWERALTASEVDAQYTISKTMFTGLI